MSGIAPTPAVVGVPDPAAAPVPTPPPAAPPADDWQTRFEAQQKVNRDLEAKLKAAIPKDEAETLRAELAKLQGREAEYAAEQARIATQREADAAALAKANDRILKAEVRAAAKGALADPEDALKYLDLSGFQVGENGDVDTAAIADAVKKLVESKPYLAAQGGNPGTVFTSPTAAREGQQTEAQWTEAQLAAATPEQIAQALNKGLLKAVLGGKPN